MGKKFKTFLKVSTLAFTSLATYCVYKYYNARPSYYYFNFCFNNLSFHSNLLEKIQPVEMMENLTEISKEIKKEKEDFDISEIKLYEDMAIKILKIDGVESINLGSMTKSQYDQDRFLHLVGIKCQDCNRASSNNYYFFFKFFFFFFKFFFFF